MLQVRKAIRLIFQTTTNHSLDNNSECHLGRYQRDGELGPSGHGELRPDQTLDSHDVNIHHLLHIPENASGGSSDQHLLCCSRRAALHLWETLQVGGEKISLWSLEQLKAEARFF